MQTKTTKQETEKMTCQICARKIKASAGWIAHHGYTRPFEGWQTNSCEGATYAPYEVSCDRLVTIIERTGNFIALHVAELANLQTSFPQTITVTEKYGYAQSKSREVTYTKPEGFTLSIYGYCLDGTYEKVYRNEVKRLERIIKGATAHVADMEKRLQDFKLVSR